MVRAEGGRRNRRFLSAAVTSGTGDARGRKEQQGAWGRARRRFKEAGRGEDAPTTRNVGVERLRLAIDWRGESGRKGNALTGRAGLAAAEREGGTAAAVAWPSWAAARRLRARWASPRTGEGRASGPRGENGPAVRWEKKACGPK